MYEKAQGVIFVYNVFYRGSFEKVVVDRESFLRSVEREDIPILILALQPPLTSLGEESGGKPVVSTKEGQRLAKRLNCQFLELLTTSANPPLSMSRFAESVEEIFFNFTRDIIKSIISVDSSKKTEHLESLPEYNLVQQKALLLLYSFRLLLLF